MHYPYRLPDVDGLAVVANPRAHAEGKVPGAGVGLDGVVQVVGDGGAVSQLQRHAVAVHQGAVEPRDHALDRKIDKLRDNMWYLIETNKIQVWIKMILCQ